MHKSGLLVLVLLGLTGFHHGAEAEQEDQHVVELVRSMINEATDPLNTSAVVTLDQKQMPCLYKSRVVSDPDTNKDEDPGKQLVSHARSLLIGTMRGIIVALHPDSALPDCEHLMTSDKVKGDESAKPVPNVVVIENQTESLQVMDDNPDVMYLSANDSSETVRNKEADMSDYEAPSVAAATAADESALQDQLTAASNDALNNMYDEQTVRLTLVTISREVRPVWTYAVFGSAVLLALTVPISLCLACRLCDSDHDNEDDEENGVVSGRRQKGSATRMVRRIQCRLHGNRTVLRNEQDHHQDEEEQNQQNKKSLKELEAAAGAFVLPSTHI